MMESSKTTVEQRAREESETRVPLPRLVRKNTLLLSVGQMLYTVVAQINVFLGAFMIVGLTGDLRLAGFGTAIAWGGRLLIAYHSGRLMDRLGRIRVLQLGTALSITGAVTVSASLFAGNLAGTIAGLLVYGLGVGATNQNRIAVADMFPADRRAEGIGYLLTGSVVGALIATPYIFAGTFLADLLGYENLTLPYAAILWLTTPVLLAPAMILTRLVRPDPKTIAENLTQYYPEKRDILDGMARDNTRPVKVASYTVLATFAVSGLTQGNMTMNMAFVPEVLHYHGAAVAIISTAITLHIIGMYALSTPLGRWADRIGRRGVLMLGAAISGIGALVTPLANEFWTITLGIFLVGLGWSAATVASTALLSDIARAGERGKVIGLNDFVLGAAALIFPATGGIVLGSEGNFLALAVFGATAAFPAVLLAFFLRETRN